MASAKQKRRAHRASGIAPCRIAMRLCAPVLLCIFMISAACLPAAAQQGGDDYLLRGPSDDLFADGGIGEFDNSAEDRFSADGDADDETGASRQNPRRRNAVPGDRANRTTATNRQARATRVTRQGPVGGTQGDIAEGGDGTGLPDTGTNQRVTAVEPGTPRAEPEDPFAQLGFRVGSWRAFARVEQSIGHASNNSFTAGGEPGTFSQTDANLTLRSDWARHEAEITADGSFRRAYGSADEEIPEAAVAGELRLDLIDGVGVNLRAGYNFSTEATSSTELGGGVGERPGVHALEASAEAERTGGKLDLTLRGSLDRTWYENATLVGGGVLDQSDRDNNLWRVSGRLAYGTTPAIKPFVEAGLGWRVHDETIDRNGQRRDSTLLDLRAGLEFDLSEKLTGEISALYINERFEDSALNSIDGYGVSADLNWSPERDTVVTFSADTDIEASTSPGNSGSVVNSFSARVERRVRDNLAVNAFAGVDIERFEGSGVQDTTYSAGAGIEYWISRFVSLTGDVEYQQFDAADPASSWDSTSVRVGVALQR